jgi:hypothetical protein
MIEQDYPDFDRGEGFMGRFDTHPWDMPEYKTRKLLEHLIQAIITIKDWYEDGRLILSKGNIRWLNEVLEELTTFQDVKKVRK